jgi:hypothetical protein
MKAEPHKVIEELIQLRYKKAYSNAMMIEHLKKKYKYKQSRCYELIREMKLEIGEAYAEVNKNVLEDAVEFMESQKADALKQKNSKLALEFQKEINKVQQLHIQKMEIDMKVEQPLFAPVKKEKND